MGTKVRFGVIGCGRMGLRRASIITNHQNSELVGVADTSEDLAIKASKDYKCAYFADYKDLVNHPDIDCIVICTPNSLHLPMTSAAAANKKHIFCEKPLARNPKEAIAMVKASNKNNVFLKVGSNLRFFPNVIKAKEIYDSGIIGDAIFFRGWIGVAGTHLDKTWFSDPEQSGGGVFLDMGCHLFDLSRLFLGEVEECTGYTDTLHWPVKPIEDIGMGIFKFNGGKLASIQATWMEWADYTYIEIYGKDGYIRIDCRMPNNSTTVGTRDGHKEVFDYTLEKSISYETEFNSFISAILNQTQPQPSGYDGQRSVQMAHALYKSSKLGKSVKI